MNFQKHLQTIYFWLFGISYLIIVLPTHMHTLIQFGQLGQLSYTILLWIGYMMASFLLRVLAFRPHRICQWLNAGYRFYEKFTETFTQPDNVTKRDRLHCEMIEKCTFALFCILCMIGVLTGWDCFMHPQAPTYILFGIEKRLVFWPIYFYVFRFCYCL